MNDKPSRKRWRRKQVADHFCVSERTVDGWAKRGVIDPPHYLEGSPIPFWFSDQFDEKQAEQSA
jgi:hypothetical protein